MVKKQLDLKHLKNSLRTFYQDNLRMPSYSELATLWGYKSKGAVRYVVDLLLEAGIIAKDQKGKILPGRLLGGYPLLGSVKAGFPSPAEEELIDTLSFDQFLVQKPESTYLVQVSGDSMIQEGIKPGDLVLVERTSQAQEGDIVIAEVDGDWTMKFLGKQAGKTVLLAANPAYAPIYPKAELQIGGVVRAVIRKYK